MTTKYHKVVDSNNSDSGICSKIRILKYADSVKILLGLLHDSSKFCNRVDSSDSDSIVLNLGGGGFGNRGGFGSGGGNSNMAPVGGGPVPARGYGRGGGSFGGGSSFGRGGSTATKAPALPPHMLGGGGRGRGSSLPPQRGGGFGAGTR